MRVKTRIIRHSRLRRLVIPGKDQVRQPGALLRLRLGQTLALAVQHQFGVIDQRHSVRLGKGLRALADDTSRAGDLRFSAQKAVEAIDKVCHMFHAETLPDLIAKLGDDDPEIRASAAAAVARHGTRAKAAVPALARALDDPDPKVQQAASAALGVIE